LTFGRLQRGDLGDDVFIVLLGNEQSQTVEVQCHGGPGVVAWLLRFAEDVECRRIDWNEWLCSTTSTTDDAALWSLLAHAVTKRTAAILLDQCQGAFEHELTRLRGLPDAAQRLEAVHQLRRWESLGKHLVRPWKVAFAGAPNAGKSSLFNALLGFERAITAPSPGTTRDVVSATLVWHGFAFELLDTAGLRTGADVLEAAGVERAVQTHQQADLVLWILDLSDSNPLLPEHVQPTFLIGAKSDLPHRNGWPCDFQTSATSGEGIPALLDAILHHVLPELPPPGQAIPVLQSQRDALARMDQASPRG